MEFDQHIPVRGRKPVNACLLTAQFCEFDQHIPVRGRKQEGNVGIKVIILPNLTNTSPLGDGNREALDLCLDYRLVQFDQHIPVRGRKPGRLRGCNGCAALNLTNTSPLGDGNQDD